jgi:phosphatidylserine/phosphatidylglycerophosphate/cardiolipin synthase-like enzyme
MIIGKKILFKYVLIIFLTTFTLSLIGLLTSRYSNFLNKPSFDSLASKQLDINDDFRGELLFSSPTSNSEFVEKILEKIESARYSIDIILYSFDHDRLLELLEIKKQEGLEINIILPKTKQDQYEKINSKYNFNIKMTGKDRESFVHHKFIVIDYGHENSNLVFTSSNMTDIQEKYDPGFILLTTDTNLVDVLFEEFKRINNNNYGYKKVFSKNYNPFAANINYNNGFVETWFSPGYNRNSVKYRIIELIESAEESVKIIGWRINDKDILNALVKQLNEGTKVTVLAGDYYFYDQNSIADNLREVQSNLNLENQVYSDSFYNLIFDLGILPFDPNLENDFNSFLHHHAMIVDDKYLVTGTNNWGYNGFYANDESVIVTDVKSLVSDFVNYFDYLKNDLVGQRMNYKIEKENIEFKNLPNEARLLVYIEESFPQKRGEICHSVKIENNVQTTIPKECFTNRTRLFILNNDNTLFGSDYLDY